jgi:hypothetical protein
VLGTIYDGLEIAGPMFAFFDALGLIEPVDIEIALDDRGQLRPARRLHRSRRTGWRP